MSFPKYLKLFGLKIPLRFSKTLKYRNPGYVTAGEFNRDEDSPEIEVDAGLSHAKKTITIWHELGHAALFRRHISDKISDELEEDIILAFEDMTFELFDVSLKKKK